MIPDAERRETVRHAILDFLVPRQSLMFDAAIIRQRLTSSRSLDFNPTYEDVTAALSFLLGLKLISQRVSAVGKTIYYQASSAGVLAHERGVLETQT